MKAAEVWRVPSLDSVLKIVLWSLSVEEYTAMLNHLTQQESRAFRKTCLEHPEIWRGKSDRYYLIAKRLS